jgi:hypothetical protein
MRENSSERFLVNKSNIRGFIKIIVSTVLFLGLGGCAAYQNKFDCPPGKGAHCSSVEEIEQMINNGQVWKVNGKVKVAKETKRFRRNCAGQTCDATYEFDDGLKSKDSMEIERSGVNYFGEK